MPGDNVATRLMHQQREAQKQMLADWHQYIIELNEWREVDGNSATDQEDPAGVCAGNI